MAEAHRTEDAEQAMTHQPAISFSIFTSFSFQSRRWAHIKRSAKIMKRHLVILSILMATFLTLMFAATFYVYVPLVHGGIIKASGRDQNIVSPLWAKAVFSPAAANARSRDLSRFREHYLGTWTSTDASFPYKITLESLAFDTATGKQFVAGEASEASLRDMVHHLHRKPFSDPIMYVAGSDDWYIRFREGGQLILSIPAGDMKNGSRPMHRIPLQKMVEG